MPDGLGLLAHHPDPGRLGNQPRDVTTSVQFADQIVFKTRLKPEVCCNGYGVREGRHVSRPSPSWDRPNLLKRCRIWPVAPAHGIAPRCLRRRDGQGKVLFPVRAHT